MVLEGYQVKHVLLQASWLVPLLLNVNGVKAKENVMHLTYHVYRYKKSGELAFKQCYMGNSNPDQYTLWYRLNRCYYKLSYAWANKKEANRPSCFIWKGKESSKFNIDFTHANIKKYMTLERLVNR